MEEFLGVSWPVFIGLTIVLFGGAAWLTGQAVASGWRPVSYVVGYTLLLGLGDRFLTFALFGGPLLSLQGYIIDTAVLMVFCLVGYRATRAGMMVKQYPWLYERSGLLGWREKQTA